MLLMSKSLLFLLIYLLLTELLLIKLLLTELLLIKLLLIRLLLIKLLLLLEIINDNICSPLGRRVSINDELLHQRRL